MCSRIVFILAAEQETTDGGRFVFVPSPPVWTNGAPGRIRGPAFRVQRFFSTCWLLRRFAKLYQAVALKPLNRVICAAFSAVLRSPKSGGGGVEWYVLVWMARGRASEKTLDDAASKKPHGFKELYFYVGSWWNFNLNLSASISVL